MSELQERCVLLKNLPHTCEERAVRDTLDLAHGDFRYDGKYEKLHRHIEFGDDVRWIVLFYSKKDAIECITSGPWVSAAIRGGCTVRPDYCSGCIIPDEWSEETPGDGDWDMGDSFRTRDCNTDTSDEFMNSFVNVKSYKYENDTDSGDDIHEQDVANANRETDGLDDALNLTVKFQNEFETLITEIDSSDQFDSGKSNEAADEVKDELNFESTSRNVSPIGEERIPTSELFGSGGFELKEKEIDEITINKSKENIEKTVTKGATGVAIDIDRGTRKPDRKSFDSGRDLYSKAEKTSVILESTKTKAKTKSEHEGSEYYDDGKVSSVSSSELFESGDKVLKEDMQGPDDLLDKTKNNNAKKQAENRKEITFDEPHVSHTHSETKTDAEKSKKAMSASVRSVDLFGSGHESMEFHNMEKQDHFEGASREQGAVNKDTDNETDEAKSEALKEKPVTTNLETCGGVQAGSGINQGGPYPFQGAPYPYQTGQNPYQGVPYPCFGTMFPNSHGASNATYESNMTMMGQGQPQPNETSPGNPGSACNMNQMQPMYQMHPQWPMPMPVQVNDKGQPIYPIPFPGMMPQMQIDEKGNPVQNYMYPGMVNPFYFIPCISGQPPFPTSGLQQSSEEKKQAIDEGHSAHAPLYTEPNNAETNMKTKEGSKPLKYDRSKSLNETEGYVYDVPYSNHRGLARQTSASDTLGNTEDIRPYSLAREIKSDIVSDKESDKMERKITQLEKSVYREENIYDVIDEDKLKSVCMSSRHPAPPPAPPRTRPPSKPRTTDTNESRLSIYDDNEYENNLEGNDNGKSEGAEESCRTILVTGLSLDVSKEALELYFENKKKTGGGEIVSAIINEKKLEAVIEFKESEVAAAVIQRGLEGKQCTIAGCQLTVSEYHPPPVDPFKIFISGISETTTMECITNFLAAQTHSEPSTIILGETPGTALVLFDTRIDKAKLRKVCEGRKLEGNYWNISDVEIVRSIKVEGDPSQSITKDSLCLYFENKRRSSGGNVESVEHREDHGDFIVTFEKFEDAERVCTVSHKLGGKEIKVTLFYPCLELDEDFFVRIPPPIQLDGIDEYIVKFLKYSTKYKEFLESSLQRNNASLHWHTGEQIFMQVECTVDPKDKKGHLKVKNWAETCTKIAVEISEKLAVERSKNVALEVWNEMKVRLGEIAISDPEAIAVFLENSDCKIVLAGEKTIVQHLTKQIEDIIEEIENDLETKRQIITKKRQLKHYEMALIRASRIETSLKNKLAEFVINNEQREVFCKGMQKDVEEALSKIDKTLKSFVKKAVPGMSKLAIDLLFKKEARDLVKKKMIERKVIGVWDTVRGSGLFMYSKNDKDLDLAIDILETSVKMDSIALDSEKRDILDSKDGKAKLAELEENNSGCIIFALMPEELRFVCVDELYKEVKDEFTKLFDLHSLVSKPVPTEFGILEYIRKYKRREIEAIENQFKRLAVEIALKESKRNPGFIVKGKKDGCILAITKVQSLIDLVVHKDHAVSWPGFDKFIKSNEGKDCIHMIEMNEKCVIKVSSEDLSSELESTVYRKPRSEEQKNKEKQRKITKEVKIGTLALEKVDVIVNSTNKDLDMSLGAISRSLLKVGGDAITQECKTKYPDGIKPGRLAATTGGSLACAEIFHGLLVKWDGGQGHAENVMETFVRSCLALAHTHNYSSIAFPALGTGALGFPADVVANIMFNTVDAFEARYPDTSLRLVRFVLWSEDRVTAKAFKDVESKSGGTKRPSSALYNYSRSETAEEVIVKNKGYSTTVGSVTVSIVKDDLTTLTSGAIVNSTMDDLNLDSGAISRAILIAAGQTIQREALAKREYFLANGLVVTGPGKLMCQSIIHVRARNTLNTWADTIWKCLSVAEQLGLNSIAFPALGTGGKGVAPERMAKTMIETFQNYIKSQDFKRCIKTIRVVIFDEKMLELFISEIRAIMEPDKAPKKKGFFSDLKFWEKTPQVTAPVPRTTFHIYCESKYQIDRVAEKVDKIRRENDVFVKKDVFDQMEETQKSDLKRIGFSNGVKVVVGKTRVTVLGYGNAADTATKKIEVYIDGFERDIRKGYSSSAVKLPKSWTKMKLTDPTATVMLLPGDQDMVWVSQKFQVESGIPSTNIVKIERIQNPTLYTQYAGKKTQMEIHNKGGRQVERLLWHGTDLTAANLIKILGFDRNYNSGSSHGAGVYFAVKASTSANGYCSPDAFGNKHIFLAHVLTGEYCMGQYGIRVPPANPASKSGTYDSTTDNVQAPNFFVIFHDAQAYPSYLITFK
ncbi:protein mono-ADP-ribosyltransferase PARP14-like [Ruditapes philippinarum]|uniref:protein mono-ADP-ribosyltransferase PARP14-like n=1 Tax=Ruditapes philippinarum TaxID=129788 RepID=UPI00295AC3A4|nr:protein mono-ADP-ribosyltransferase PARP14-like [Ruditapes philippinarum]